MARIQQKCKYCDKQAIEASRTEFGDELIITLECGHSYGISKSEIKDASSIVSLTNRQLYPFQVKSVNQLEEFNCRGGIFHEMGLGKTPISAVLLSLHDEMLPAVLLCKSGLKTQLAQEFLDWSGGKLVSQIISSPREPILGLPLTIISLDLLRNLNGLVDYPWKTVIIDECQLIKNPESKRSKEVSALCKNKDYVLGLTGTPFENHAGEYFTILNILNPLRFPSMHRYAYEFLDYSRSAFGLKVYGIRRSQRPAFREVLSKFTIRSTRAEVMPELPTISRRSRLLDFASIELKNQYDNILKDFLSEMDDVDGEPSSEQFTNLLAYIAKMRHVCGLAKVEPTVEFAEEFLLETDRKLILFVHHRDVGDQILDRLTETCKAAGYAPPAMLRGGMSDIEKDDAITQFKLAGCRILIASTLAAGEGLNLQFASDAVFVEREWNPQKEEQGEGRIARIGQIAESLFATYLIAVGTIDEYFANLVEQKRAQFQQVMNGSTIEWNETSIIKDLMGLLSSRGRKGFNLR